MQTLKASLKSLSFFYVLGGEKLKVVIHLCEEKCNVFVWGNSEHVAYSHVNADVLMNAGVEGKFEAFKFLV